MVSKYIMIQNFKVFHSIVYCNTVQYSTAQENIVQYNTVQHSSIQYITVHYGSVQRRKIQHNTVQYSIVQYRTVQYSTGKYSTVQYSAAIIIATHSLLSQTKHYKGRTFNPTRGQCKVLLFTRLKQSIVQFSVVQFNSLIFSYYFRYL